MTWRQNGKLWLSLRLRHPSSWNNVALNASRTVFNSHGPYCNSSETVWQSFNCFILERGYYNRVLNVYDEVLLFITEHKVAEKWLSGNGLQKASTSHTDPLHNVLLPFLPFLWNIWKYRIQIIGRGKGVPFMPNFLSLPQWGSVS